METVNIHDAKTHLSRYLAKVEAGDEVTIARNGTPVAKLVPIPSTVPRTPGRFAGKIEIHDSFYDPMSEEELREFEKGHPADPLNGD